MSQQINRSNTLDATSSERWAYVTRGNELLQDIARIYGVRTDELVRANPHVRNVYMPASGTVLFIPLDKADPVFINRLGQHMWDERRRRLIRWSTQQIRGGVPEASETAQRQTEAEEITAEQLRQIIPQLGERASVVVVYLNQAMDDGQVTTRLGQAMFLSQVAVESDYFTTLEERGANSMKRCADGTTQPYFAYMYDKTSCNERRRRKAAELGNTQEGDGARYHGRGYIQLTGRTNYRNAGTYLGLSLESNPEIAAQPESAARIAGWFWRFGNGNLNNFTDRDTDANFRQVTRRINGDDDGQYTHRDRRLAIYNEAKAVFDIE